MCVRIDEFDKDRPIASLRKAKGLAIVIITQILSERFLGADEKAERLERLIMGQHGVVAYHLGNPKGLTFSTWQLRIIFELMKQMSGRKQYEEILGAFKGRMHDCIKKYRIFEARYLVSSAAKDEHGRGSAL